MAHILALETTTKSCSVVIAFDEKRILKKETQSSYTHSENLTRYIEEVINKSGISLDMLDAVVISKGPGSYMGLRIGTSTAKGLCYALEKPLIAVDTLKAMALKASKLFPQTNAIYCPMLDARRMEVYCALYDSSNVCITPTEAKIINEHSFTSELKNNMIYFFGDGAAKCKDVFKNKPNAVVVDDYNMSADALIPLAYEKFRNNQFEDLAYFEPFYLKDFIPGIPKVKGLK